MAPTARRQLIVNADDFGQSAGINRGIIHAHENGIVTSASLMVRWPFAAEAAEFGRRRDELSIGLHFDFGEWIFQRDQWFTLYEVVSLDDSREVANEAARQLAEFRRLMGKNPTHLDSHQHVHRSEPLRSALAEIARELTVPLRHFSSLVQYCGDFYGQTGRGELLEDNISVAGLIKLVNRLPSGVTELGCHPGYGRDYNSMYRASREVEVESLCSADVRKAIDLSGIELVGFRQLIQ